MLIRLSLWFGVPGARRAARSGTGSVFLLISLRNDTSKDMFVHAKL
jgi:hypothetical protein